MSANLLAWLGLGDSLSDEQAMWRVKMEGDPHAFALLVRRWQAPIQRLCARMIGDLQRAEDLAQDTFARLFNHRTAYAADAKFSTYLWRIALNLCYDELRRRKRRAECSIEGDPENPDHPASAALLDDLSPDRQLWMSERAQAVREAVLSLPEHARVVVVLKHYEGLKFREIAEVLGIPEGTAKSRMAEALNQLSSILSSNSSMEATYAKRS